MVYSLVTSVYFLHLPSILFTPLKVYYRQLRISQNFALPMEQFNYQWEEAGNIVGEYETFV